MSIRLLRKDLQIKAENELHETPTRIQEDLNHIRDWLSKQPHLNSRKDDQWLVGFLRGCKFSLERTKQKLDMFCTVKTLLPEFFSDRDPFSAEMQQCLKEGPIVVLPATAYPTGPVIAIIRIVSDNITPTTVVKLTLMMMEIFINESDNFTVAGQRMLVDLKGLTYKHVVQVTPSLIKKMTLCFQNAYPTRLKGYHLINTPLVFESAYNMMKTFFSKKVIERMQFHSDSDFGSIYEHIPPSILPREYGGEGSSIDELTTLWKQKVESYRHWFLDDVQYRSDESKRVGKPRTAADMFGVEGSFRKLDVD